MRPLPLIPCHFLFHQCGHFLSRKCISHSHSPVTHSQAPPSPFLYHFLSSLMTLLPVLATTFCPSLFVAETPPTHCLSHHHGCDFRLRERKRKGDRK